MSQRRDKFVQLAEKRTINAIKSIRIIGKLGNRSHYDYAERDVRKIAGALTKEVDALKRKMLNSGAKNGIDFKL